VQNTIIERTVIHTLLIRSVRIRLQINDWTMTGVIMLRERICPVSQIDTTTTRVTITKIRGPSPK
jgi:wobble nucleotide-excising tRNase